MIIHVLGLDHVVLRVRDFDRALGFYCGVLGGQIARENDHLKQVRLGRNLIDLALIGDGKTAAKDEGNMAHFALQVAPFDEAAFRDYLTAKGVVILGPAARRHGAGGVGPSLYVEDPDGNTVELKGPADG